MTKTTVRVVGHYEVEETPFDKSYKWHPAYVNLECDCGAQLTLSGASGTAPAYSRCRTDHGGVIDEIQKREGRLGMRSPISGATTPKSRRNNVYETKPLTLRAPPGATTTSCRVVRMTDETFDSGPLRVSKFQRPGAPSCP